MKLRTCTLALFSLLIGCHDQRKQVAPKAPEATQEAKPPEPPKTPEALPEPPNRPEALPEPEPHQTPQQTPEAPPQPQPGVPAVPILAPEAARAKVLTYVNPVAKGFRLEVEPSTNQTASLKLNLIGPKGTLGQGVAFFLQVDPLAAAWANPEGGTGVVRAGRSWPSGRSGPRLAWAKAEGGRLQAGLFRKNKAPGAMDAGPILSLALRLEAGASRGAVNLSAPTDRQAVYLDGNNDLVPLHVAVGTLVAE